MPTTNSAVSPPVGATSALFASYVQLTEGLLEQVTGIVLVDRNLHPQGEHGNLTLAAVSATIRSIEQQQPGQRVPQSFSQGVKLRTTVIPLEQGDGASLGYFCLQMRADLTADGEAAFALTMARKLKPVLDCLSRELAAIRPADAEERQGSEQNAELEWLFELTGRLNGTSNEGRVLPELLQAACGRLGADLAVLHVPEKQVCIKYVAHSQNAEALLPIWDQTSKHLLTWAERQNRPLVVDGAAARGAVGKRSRLLSVPLVRDSGRVIGYLAFFGPDGVADFAAHQVFLARHVARQASSLVESQFDLMTGLYTRDGLEQVYNRMAEDTERGHGSVLYLDIDRVDVVNELHGFELGNELIVRTAELLTAPWLSADALASRLSGDRFAVVLPGVDPDEAARQAATVQAAAARLTIGPPESPVEVSISCGIAALVIMPQGLARAVAAAEIACKRAKSHGRNRVELYSCDDTSIMQRNDDIAAVAQLRAAFKADRVLLYAQRIVPLQNPDLPCSYEILMRLRDASGELVSPGHLITAAQRYQLLPAIDRRVVEGAMQALAPYRNTLFQSGVSFSINVTGQSICDEDFVSQFAERLGRSHLPRGAVTIEITEQSAVTNLARANQMVERLGALGCRLALDDFGTGSNSLANLKSLQIARVKIDGSFVRDVLTDRRSHTTVKAIVELAKGYGIDTVAEYVESIAIADLLRKIGVDYAQGYAFSRPEPLAQVLQELSGNESRKVHDLFMTL